MGFSGLAARAKRPTLSTRLTEQSKPGGMEERGLYILVARLKENQKIKPGRLEETEFKKGVYLYVGRAKKGIWKRVGRHLKKKKKCFWHIDYFLRRAEVREVWIKPGLLDECRLVSQIRRIYKRSEIPQKKFGASDCRCAGHLLYLLGARNLRNLRERLALEKLETQ